MYSHDLDILATDQIPVHRRKPRVLAWAKVLLSSLKATWDAFNSDTGLVYTINDQLKYNGQTCYMQLAIDNMVSAGLVVVKTSEEPMLQLYWFEDDDADDTMFTFEDADEADPLFEQQYLFEDTDYEGDFDIQLEIQNTLTNEQRANISGIVSLYKVAGKRWGYTNIA